MGRKSTRREIRLSDDERQRLEHVANNPRSLRKHVWRARIILELGSGCGLVETMRRTGMSKPTVWRWWARFLAEGVDGLLHDATRPPGKKPISGERVKAAIALAMSPPPHARRWTVRELAERLGMSVSTMHNILKANGVRPNQVKTFKVPRDPRFGIKVGDVVGLYVDPPDHAVILSVDEKPQIQPLGRTQKSLPMKPGHAGTKTHDHKRNGTACLLTALDAATCKAIHQTARRQRSAEFLAFLDHVAEGIETGRPAHVILDNISPHKLTEIREWLRDRPDWQFHFTPTSASWMNAVEGFFLKLTRKRLRHAVFDSLDECTAAIDGYIAHHNADHARPFRWSRMPLDPVEARKIGHRKLDEMESK
ncbi:MAG: IS630 family transposase [Rhodobacteraceae bacterium]|nr:IS630 family transposase [Paracoccaceae bacterium]